MERRAHHGSLGDVSREEDKVTLLQRHHSVEKLDAPANQKVNTCSTLPSTSGGELPVPVPSGQVPEAMDADLCAARADLGAAHFQSSAARRCNQKITATSLTADNTFFNTITVEPDKTGSMNPEGDQDVLRTFRGVRLHRGGEMINQYVTMSIDPSNMQCLSCAEEHPVPQGNKPVLVVLSDENFVPMWPGTVPESCVVVVRVDGGSLFELVDIFGDIFSRGGLPEGSVMLLGSISHLHKNGVGRYAADWTKIAMKITRSWPTVRLCPLTPIIREDVPGGIARDLAELAVWFSRVYEGNIQGLHNCWTVLVRKSVEHSTGSTELTHPESYVVHLPDKLDENAKTSPHTFVTKNSRPSALKGLDKGSQIELLTSLSVTLGRDFLIPAGIGACPENVTEQTEGNETIVKLILVGASNLNRAGIHFEKQGYTVVNLCVPGWVSSPTNVAEMLEKLSTVTVGNDTAIVLDVFGNSTFRYENYDGSVLMPVKMGGGYHLIGEVTVCNDNVFSKQIDTVLPLLEAVPGTVKIVVPPQPRYLFGSCCRDPNHCTNVPQVDHPTKLLGASMHLRDVLKKKLVGKLNSNFWISDSCLATNVNTGATVTERCAGLKSVFAQDHVHFSMDGYTNIAKNISNAVRDLSAGKVGKYSNENRTAASGVSGVGRNHFWRGISSPVGSCKPSKIPHHHKYRDRSSKTSTTPYRRFGGGGAESGEPNQT